MNKSTTPTERKIFFETSRLLFRKSDYGDAKAMTDVFSDPEVMKYMSLSPLQPGVTIESVIDRFNAYIDKNGHGMWAIVQKSDGKFIGLAGLKHLDNTEQLEAGLLIAKAYWNKGYASEFMLGIFEFGFNVLKLEKIVSVIHPENHVSVHFCENCGMKNEGKKHYYNRDGFYLSMTKNRYIEHMNSSKKVI